jgi:DNA gyrase subunit A
LDDDLVAGMDVIDTSVHTHVLVVTRNGYGKRTALDQYSLQSRYGLGSRTLARNEKTGPIVATRTINEEDQIMLMTRAGIVLRTDLQSIRETGRSTQGVILMDLADTDEVVGIALLKDEEDDSENEIQALENFSGEAGIELDVDVEVEVDAAVDEEEESDEE